MFFINFRLKIAPLQHPSSVQCNCSFKLLSLGLEIAERSLGTTAVAK